MRDEDRGGRRVNRMVESVVRACLMEYDERATLNFIIGSGRSSRKKQKK